MSDKSLAAARRNGELINLERFDAVLTRAFRATRCRAVALVINSPGGSPAQSSLIYKRLRELRRRHPKTKLLAYVQASAASLSPGPSPGPGPGPLSSSLGSFSRACRTALPRVATTSRARPTRSSATPTPSSAPSVSSRAASAMCVEARKKPSRSPLTPPLTTSSNPDP